MLSIAYQILEQITELGYISLKNGNVINTIKPKFNVYSDDNVNLIDYPNRWNITIQYLTDYVKYHPDFDGEYFICIYDGWREDAQYVAMNENRTYVSWHSLSSLEQSYYLGIGSINEPRFVSKYPNHPEIYPELPLPIIAYNRHYNDRNVLLIPDSEYLLNEFDPYIRKVISNDIPWELKESIIYWRGGRHINEGYTYLIDQKFNGLFSLYGLDRIHPRELITALIRNEGFIPDISNVLDSSYDYSPLSNALKYKYLLDIDGQVSAWSSLFWKLYSSSVVMKAPSHWEQWYYNDFINYQHYIQLPSLHPIDLLHSFQWCEEHSRTCKEISYKSTLLIKKYTYEYSVKEYIIH